MLIEGYCKKGNCSKWYLEALSTPLTPQCPTCKEYNTFILLDETPEPDESINDFFEGEYNDEE